MAKVLLLGAGFVTGPLVDYLHSKDHEIIIGSQFLPEATQLVNGRKGLTPLQVDVTNKKQLTELVEKTDLVVSFVPFQFHVLVARICIEQKTSMVTASYAQPEMLSLNQAALDADIIILNEIGVDPGIDHMTAMQVIDQAHDRGEQVEALVSWCGGIPSPEANNNPLGYKFSWSPMAVLTAVSNDAKYLRNGQLKHISGNSLLTLMKAVSFNAELGLKGYANRDSLTYQTQYAIPEVKTLLRGTLRYPGFGKIIDAAKQTGLLSDETFPGKTPDTWKALMCDLTGLSGTESLTSFYSDTAISDCFKWLGCFSDEPVAGDSPIAAFCQLLSDKLQYEKGEQDMIAMQHRFVLVDKNGVKKFHRSTLVEKGEAGGFSAMAKTVGYPAAIAADMILSGQITRKGVCIPVTRDIYEPVLEVLKSVNIMMTEEIVVDQNEDSFLNHL